MQPPARRNGARRRAGIVVAAVLGVLVVGALLVVGRHADTDGRGISACSATAVRGPDGTPWHCTFDDEFAGTSLGTTWTVQRTAVTGFHSGEECYVDDPTHVAVTAGHLALTATRAAANVGCHYYSTPYLSGMITSKGGFAQKYGRFEIRAELPVGVGLQPALWLMPASSVYGPWPHSGEIDVAESYGSAPGAVQPHAHYLASGGVAAAPGTTCRLTGRGFHTFGLTWSPNRLSVDYDGRQCWQLDDWHPVAPLSAPAPFDQRFYLNLTLALGSAATPYNRPGVATPLSSTLLVDWVRVWGA